MTQQTLREEWYKTWSGSKENMPEFMNIAADFFLARFKEFAEKELIGANLALEHSKHCIWQKEGDNCDCNIEAINLINALRNEQREILSEYFK